MATARSDDRDVEFDQLIEQSSLGSVGARRLRQRVSDAQVQQVRDRLVEESVESGHGATRQNQVEASSANAPIIKFLQLPELQVDVLGLQGPATLTLRFGHLDDAHRPEWEVTLTTNIHPAEARTQQVSSLEHHAEFQAHRLAGVIDTLVVTNSEDDHLQNLSELREFLLEATLHYAEPHTERSSWAGVVLWRRLSAVVLDRLGRRDGWSVHVAQSEPELCAADLDDATDAPLLVTHWRG